MNTADPPFIVLCITVFSHTGITVHLCITGQVPHSFTFSLARPLLPTHLVLCQRKCISIGKYAIFRANCCPTLQLINLKACRKEGKTIITSFLHLVQSDSSYISPVTLFCSFLSPLQVLFHQHQFSGHLQQEEQPVQQTTRNMLKGAPGY